MNGLNRSALIRASLWLSSGAILLVYSAIATVGLLQRPEPFRLTEGPEQPVLIFWFIAIVAVAQALLQFAAGIRHPWLWKALAVPLVFGSFVWLLFGGPAYESWLFSAAVALVFVASTWQLLHEENDAQPRAQPGRSSAALRVVLRRAG